MVTRLKVRAALLVAIAAATIIALPLPSEWAASGARSINFTDHFDSGKLDAWQMPYPEDWAILGESGNHYLHMKRSRDPGVPRRPLQYALLKNVNVGSFDLRVRVRREGGSMIVVFNYVDTLHFYYTHLSLDSGRKAPVHNGIFLVNNAPRVRIAGTEAVPALPDQSWHAIRVLRDAKTGKIDVWSDVQSGPLFTVVDHTFGCGQVGLGSFDETGDFSDFDLKSEDGGCAS
jgi:hypothetical protein